MLRPDDLRPRTRSVSPDLDLTLGEETMMMMMMPRKRRSQSPERGERQDSKKPRPKELDKLERAERLLPLPLMLSPPPPEDKAETLQVHVPQVRQTLQAWQQRQQWQQGQQWQARQVRQAQLALYHQHLLALVPTPLAIYDGGGDDDDVALLYKVHHAVFGLAELPSRATSNTSIIIDDGAEMKGTFVDPDS